MAPVLRVSLCYDADAGKDVVPGMQPCKFEPVARLAYAQRIAFASRPIGQFIQGYPLMIRMGWILRDARHATLPL